MIRIILTRNTSIILEAMNKRPHWRGGESDIVSDKKRTNEEQLNKCERQREELLVSIYLFDASCKYPKLEEMWKCFQSGVMWIRRGTKVKNCNVLKMSFVQSLLLKRTNCQVQEEIISRNVKTVN